MVGTDTCGRGLRSPKTWPQVFSDKPSRDNRFPYVWQYRAEFRKVRASIEGEHGNGDGRQGDVDEDGPNSSWGTREQRPDDPNFWDSSWQAAPEEANAVARACTGIRLQQVKCLDDRAENPSTIFLYDRSIEGQPRHQRMSEISTRELYDSLCEEQFDHPMKTDAAQRMITIFDPGPCSFVALGEACLERHRSALFLSIYAYIKHKPLLDVCFHSLGLETVFRLSFSLPYPVLRSVSAVAGVSGFKELAFLGTFEDGEHGMLAIKTDVTTISGTNDLSWMDYMFLNDVPAHRRDWENEPSDASPSKDDSAADVEWLETEMITKVLDRHTMRIYPDVEDARAVFLLAMSDILTQAICEWKWLIDQLGGRIIDGLKTAADARVSLAHDHRASSDQSINVQAARYEGEVCWLQHVRDSLGELVSCLNPSLLNWQDFNTSGGDGDFFLDQKFNAMRSALDKHYVYLARVKHELLELDSRCERRMKVLELFLHGQQACNAFRQLAMHSEQLKHVREEQKEAKVTSKVTEIRMTLVAPLALATAFFAMPKEAVPFAPTFGRFIAAWVIFAAGLTILAHIPTAYHRWLGTRPQQKLGSESIEATQITSAVTA